MVVARSRALFDEAAGPSASRIVLFGAGALGKLTLSGMRAAGLSPLAIVDNNLALHGQKVEGVDVLSPEEGVRRFNADATFVIAVYNTSRPRRQLRDLGARTVVPYAYLFAKFPAAFLPYVCLGSPDPIFTQASDVRRAFDLMADDAQREVFLEQLRYRMFVGFDQVARPQTDELRSSEYFPTDLYRYLDDEVLLDCGAFDGDTVRRFLHRRDDGFARIVPCEPDPESFHRLRAWVETLPADRRRRIDPLNVAVGARREKARFLATGTMASAVGTEGGVDVQVESADHIFGDQPLTLVKVDTEGAELDVIAGARRTIQRSAPVFACTVYHAIDHLWRVPLDLHAIEPRYRFFLRAHAEDCWDASCYAVAPERELRRQ